MADKVYYSVTARVIVRGDDSTDWAAVEEGLTLDCQVEGAEVNVEDVQIEKIEVEDAK